MSQSLEYALFEWEEWDTIDVGAMQFHKCTMKQVVGSFAVGAVVEMIEIDYSHSKIRFYTGGAYVEHALTLAVGPIIGSSR